MIKVQRAILKVRSQHKLRCPFSNKGPDRAIKKHWKRHCFRISFTYLSYKRFLH